MSASLIYYLVAWCVLCVMVTADDCLSCRVTPCRRVKGIFTRPTLPTGYNLIARIPEKSCNITVQEIRSSTNYLAIRSSNGYIINGNWAVLPPGRYMGAGTGFLYSIPQREGNELIQAPGPLKDPIDIMIIYQAANPGVEYEYWHPSSATFSAPALPSTGVADLSNAGHKYVSIKKIFTGHISGIYISNQGSGASGNRNEGAGPSKEGKTGATPTRVLPNQLDNHLTPNFGLDPGDSGARIHGIEKGPSWKVWKFTPCSRTCGGGEQQTVYICTSVEGTVVDESLCTTPKPLPQTVRCNPIPCPATWQLGEWSQCSVTCGNGLMTRTWACVQEVTPQMTRQVPPHTCPPPPRTPKLPLTQPCTLGPCTRWEVSIWNKCSVECGTGVVSRHVTCRAEGRKAPEEQCNIQERPPSKQLCHANTCAHHTWFYTDWTEECFGGCEDGVQTRRVWCSPGVNTISGECNQSERPPETRPCARADACAAAWFTGPWSPCSEQCSNGTRTREVVCVVFLRGSFR
ncbi:unnamed protein product, partial [Meganyctiphanes norvegica]